MNMTAAYSLTRFVAVNYRKRTCCGVWGRLSLLISLKILSVIDAVMPFMRVFKIYCCNA